jgi:hypothetical protein
MISNGQPTQDAQRIQEGFPREIAWQQIWLPEAHSPNGSPPREEQRKIKRIIKVENATRLSGPFYLEANTTEEIELFFKDYCQWESEYIGVLFSPSPSGTMHRKYFRGKIDPSVDTIYVRLYLKKHPPIPKEVS